MLWITLSRFPRVAFYLYFRLRSPSSREPSQSKRFQALAREIGCFEGRLELTEQAESPLREQLHRERADLLEAALKEERSKVRGTLEAQRSKGFLVAAGWRIAPPAHYL
jgi:hypothetical protein